MKTFLIAVLLTMSAVLLIPVYGQSNRHSPVQVSFVYPIGTHGFKSNTYTYDFSLNMLIGRTGGINGLEIGGLINMNSKNVSGFQVAGIANITQGSVSGFQASGIFGKADSVNGLQVNGIVGQVKASTDLQVSGILNISNQTRTAIAGIANINSYQVNGLQIAGILNKTQKLKGVQVGLINIADSSDKSISIGLINIIRDRHFDEWALEVSDYQNFAISYHLGTRELYTLFSAGFNVMKDRLWVAGIGLGHEERYSPVFSIRPEVAWYTYFPMAFERPLRDTWSFHLRMAFVRDLSERLAISAAPGIYVAKKSNKGTEEDYGYEQSPIPPFFDVISAGNPNKTDFGVGFSLSFILK